MIFTGQSSQILKLDLLSSWCPSFLVAKIIKVKGSPAANCGDQPRLVPELSRASEAVRPPARASCYLCQAEWPSNGLLCCFLLK